MNNARTTEQLVPGLFCLTIPQCRNILSQSAAFVEFFGCGTKIACLYQHNQSDALEREWDAKLYDSDGKAEQTNTHKGNRPGLWKRRSITIFFAFLDRYSNRVLSPRNSKIRTTLSCPFGVRLYFFSGFFCRVEEGFSQRTGLSVNSVSVPTAKGTHF